MRTIAPIAMAIAAIWMFFGYTMPEYAVLTDRQAVVVSYQDTLDQANQLNQLKNDLLSTYKSLPQDGVTRLNTMLPSSVDQTHFIVALTSLAAADGVTLGTVHVSSPTSAGASSNGTTNTPSTPVQTGSSAGFIPASVANGSAGTPQQGAPSSLYQTISGDITVTGSYPAVVVFLHDLEQSLQLIDISSLAVSVTNMNALQENISFRTYVYGH